jgi:hypothetical protein
MPEEDGEMGRRRGRRKASGDASPLLLILRYLHHHLN